MFDCILLLLAGQVVTISMPYNKKASKDRLKLFQMSVLVLSLILFMCMCMCMCAFDCFVFVACRLGGAN